MTVTHHGDEASGYGELEVDPLCLQPRDARHVGAAHPPPPHLRHLARPHLTKFANGILSGYRRLTNR
jgi:hypothetical protein